MGELLEKQDVIALYHLSTMFIHLGHVFICFILMLYGQKLGCVGQARSFWCFGLINAPKSPHLIILVTCAPSFMIFYSLVLSHSIKQGNWLTRGTHAWYLDVFRCFGPFIASQNHCHSPMHSTTPTLPSFMSYHSPNTFTQEFVTV